MFLPVMVIIYFLGAGYTLTLSATVAIFSSIVLTLIPIIARRQWKDLVFFVKAWRMGKGSGRRSPALRYRRRDRGRAQP